RGQRTARRVDARRAPGGRVRVQRFRARLLVATRPPVAAVGALDRYALPGGIQARLSGALPGAARSPATGREPDRARHRARTLAQQKSFVAALGDRVAQLAVGAYATDVRQEHARLAGDVRAHV